MKWSMKDDEICCKIYLDEIILNPDYLSDAKSACVSLAKSQGVKFPIGSIKMKFSNIRAICDEKEIKHNSPFTPLKNYSTQNKIAFENVYSKYLLDNKNFDKF